VKVGARGRWLDRRSGGVSARAGPSWPSESGARPLHVRLVPARHPAADMGAGSTASAGSCARSCRSPVAAPPPTGSGLRSH